jgi:hypothetical protein
MRATLGETLGRGSEPRVRGAEWIGLRHESLSPGEDNPGSSVLAEMQNAAAESPEALPRDPHPALRVDR